MNNKLIAIVIAIIALATQNAIQFNTIEKQSNRIAELEQKVETLNYYEQCVWDGINSAEPTDTLNQDVQNHGNVYRWMFRYIRQNQNKE